MKIVNRIKASKDFAITIKKGKAFKNEFFVVHIATNNLDHTRVGISVSKSLGNAVIRNRVKRQIRAMVDEILDFTNYSLDIVIIARKSFLDVDFQNNKIRLSKLLNNR